MLRDLELFQRRVVVIVAVVIRKSQGQMRLRQVGLQLQSALGEGARFFASSRRLVEGMQDPAFQLRVAGESERKAWVELQCAIVELLALFQLIEILKSALEIVRLHKSEIGFAVFGRLPLDLCLFDWRQFCPQFARNLLGQISLNGENVCQIAIVIFRPNVLVILGID